MRKLLKVCWGVVNVQNSGKFPETPQGDPYPGGPESTFKPGSLLTDRGGVWRLINQTSDLIPCPVPGCPQKVHGENGLWCHLMHGHQKNVLVGALIKRWKFDRLFEKVLDGIPGDLGL